jgi:hypothetical protein
VNAELTPLNGKAAQGYYFVLKYLRNKLPIKHIVG